MSETFSCVKGSLTHVSTFTEQSTCSLAYYEHEKCSFTKSLRRAEGGLYRQRKGKIPLLILFWAEIQPFNFFNPKQMKQFGKNNMKFLRKNADEYWFFTLFSEPIKLLIFSTVFL